MAGATVDLGALQAQGKKNAESIGELSKQVKGLVDTLSKTRAGNQPDPRQVFGLPHVRTGENIMGSRGFSMLKMLGLLTKAVEPENAKFEREIHDKLHNAFTKNLNEPFKYGGGQRPGEGSFLAPLATSFFPDEYVDREQRLYMKSMMCAGVEGADPDEANWMRRKMWATKGYDVKTLSWLNELTGGALVAPPEQGELIELLRNKEALVNAGARTVPLPPQGRIRFPRQTGASTVYWVGENKPITASDIGTGDVTMQAKKLAVVIQAPNELIRFASPAAEALMRDDMTKSLALGLDLAGLEGAGGDTVPRGVNNFQNINALTSSRPGVDGDALAAEDIYRMVAVVEESNAEFEGFIMRPKTLWRYFQLRFDAVANGDAAGGFLFSMIREAGDGMKPSLAGFPVTKSTQVTQVQTKGSSGATLTQVLGGMWSDLLIGLFGAVEFSQTNQSDTAFLNDQTWVKGILSADIVARHEAAFVKMDNLKVTP